LNKGFSYRRRDCEIEKLDVKIGPIIVEQQMRAPILQSMPGFWKENTIWKLCQSV
jgi:hypothetical protein